MKEYRVLFVGLGHLGSLIFDLFTRTAGQISFLVGGRDLAYLQQRANLSLFVANQLGFYPNVSCTYLDLRNKEQTAEILASFKPDIIFCAATLQPLEASYGLPESVTRQLASAQLGPRLPLHLTLIYNMMQAIQMTGLYPVVLNAIYPDVVGPVLQQVGLAPTTGIGDLANNVPALKHSLASYLQEVADSIDVRLIMARYVSYWMSRSWNEDAPHHITALVNGQVLLYPLDWPSITNLLATKLKRVGGTTGLLMTAASAAIIFDGIVNNTNVITHAPGPGGLPGGYPVQVNTQGIEVALPSNLSLDTARQINEAGLYLDGIKQIDNDGTVHFVEKNMTIFKELLGYECKSMALTEVAEWADELQMKYLALQAKWRT